MAVVNKICYRCKVEKATSEFNKQNMSRKKDGLHSYCKECSREVSREYYMLNSNRLKQAQRNRGWRDKLLQRYGLTEQDYDEMYVLQNGRCAICKNVEINGNALSVDHNHVTGKVRALLCDKCNTGLAKFNDDSKLLLSASQYLDSHDSDNKEEKSWQ